MAAPLLRALLLPELSACARGLAASGATRQGARFFWAAAAAAAALQRSGGTPAARAGAPAAPAATAAAALAAACGLPPRRSLSAAAADAALAAERELRLRPAMEADAAEAVPAAAGASAAIADTPHQPNQQAAQQQQQQQQANQQAPHHQQQQPLDEGALAHLRAASPPPGVRKTFYKRKLPCPPAIEFSSPEGRQVFKEALEAGTMTGFFKLIEQLSTQDEPAFCGLASLAMVLNALSIDPRRTWKGSWRWFHERLLDCCLPLDRVAAEGIVLSQAACLAKCNGARVELHRSGTFTLDDFRRQLLECAASGEEHVVVSYSRRTFLQTGDGHFSPVGGVHEGRDMALILDTARFKYPPHWVPIPLLFESMAAVDAATGQPRGFLRLAVEEWPDSVLFTLDLRGGAWRAAAAFGHRGAPAAVEELARAGAAEPAAIARRLVAEAPLSSVGGFVAMRFASSLCAKDRCVPHAVRQQVLAELRATPLFELVWPLVRDDPRASGLDFAAERLCMLLLLLPPKAWPPAAAWADAGQHAAWSKLLETSSVSILESEAKYLRHQFSHIGDVIAAGQEDEHPVEDCGTCTPRPRGLVGAAAADGLLGPCAGAPATLADAAAAAAGAAGAAAEAAAGAAEAVAGAAEAAARGARAAGEHGHAHAHAHTHGSSGCCGGH